MGTLWALAGACVRYRVSVAAPVREQLKSFSEAAERLEDPALRTLALHKLSREGFNAEAAAMLATGAPRAQRAHAVEAIVALEVLYDYLDGRSESAGPAQSDTQFAPYTDALARGPAQADPERPAGEDSFARELAGSARAALAELPAIAAVREPLERAGARGAGAQTRLHRGEQEGVGQLLRWAQSNSADSGLQPREFIAGAAASVLAVHALIAAAANEHTSEAQAGAIERLYLAIAAIATLLDGAVDYDEDVGGRGCLALYRDSAELADTLAALAHKAMAETREIRGGSQHAMILAGVIAYYATAPGAEGAFAAPLLQRLGGELRGLLSPTVAVLRVWRLALRARRKRGRRLRRGIGEPWPSN